MSGTACEPINFSASPTPEKLHHLGRAFGLLTSVQHAEECQLAQIGERLIALPEDLDLSGYLGQRVGMMRYEEHILIRRLS